jgi:hypothetical protein
MKHIMLFILLFVGRFELLACDICGGVSGNASIGMFASSNFHMLGLKTQNQSFASYLNGIRHSREFIWRNEIIGRIQISKRFQLMAIIPYQFAWQQRDLGSDFRSGIGDPLIVGNTILIHKKDTTGLTKHFLSGAAGLKFPLGAFGSNESALMNLYPGTGGFDGMLMINYTKGWKKGWSIQNEASWSIKTANKFGYRYGDVVQFASNLVKNQKWNSMRFIPALGIVFNHFAPSRQNGIVLESSNNSGYVLSNKLSLNIMSYKWLISLGTQIPLIQNINKGITKQLFSAEISATYLLKFKKTKNEKI